MLQTTQITRGHKEEGGIKRGRIKITCLRRGGESAPESTEVFTVQPGASLFAAWNAMLHGALKMFATESPFWGA